METTKPAVLFLTTSILLCGCATQQPSVKQTQEPPVKQQIGEDKLADSGQEKSSLVAEKAPVAAQATPADGQAQTQKPRYEILEQLPSRITPNGYSLDLLMSPDAEQGEIVNLIKELSKGKDHVIIRVYTDRQVYEDSKRRIFDERFDRHFILFYLKHRGMNTNEIKWMQVVGKFSHLYEKTTQLQEEATAEPQKEAEIPVSPIPQPSDLQKFIDVLRTAGIDNSLIVRVSVSETGDKLIVVVANPWHYQPYQIRLQMAQSLWELWARIHSPQNPDIARLKLTDLQDNEVGGSRLLGGSLIWVTKN
jgi:hypothetical protein